MTFVGDRAKAHAGERDARCSVPDCMRPTQEASGSGLSSLYCKVHISFRARHGSYFRKSFTAGELGPYRSAAASWMRGHREESAVGLTIRALDQIMAGAGPSASAYDLRSMAPAEKARVALARLRDAGVHGDRLLEITLAVCALTESEALVDQEFIEVQIAKLAHRLASGTHKTTSGIPIRAKYAPSSGKVLRILGHAIWDIAAIVARGAALSDVALLAEPLVPLAEKAEVKRQSLLATRKKTEEAIERRIQQARDYGMGPQSLAEIRRRLRTQYGLK